LIIRGPNIGRSASLDSSNIDLAPTIIAARCSPIV
jgi:hypothetical protein